MPVELEAEISSPKEVEILHHLLCSSHGDGELYMVGGCVRDYLFHKFHGDKSTAYAPKDIDLTTDLSEATILERLSSPKAQSMGVRVKEKESVDTFGVVFVSVAGSPTYEIAPFRKDVGSSDGRRPDAIERGTIEDDAMRRDLTINNLYYDFHRKQILDFNKNGQGVTDIKDRVARFVGDPFQRIDEDKLRVLRFVRFFCRLNYYGDLIGMRTDTQTLEAIKKHKNLRVYPGMSAERIQMEFRAGIKQAISTPAYILALRELDLLPAVFPDLDVNVSRVRELRQCKNERVILARILKGNRDIGKALNALNYPNEISEAVQFLVNAQVFNPSRAVPVIKERDRKVIKATSRDLTPEESLSNDLVVAQVKSDLLEIAALEDDAMRSITLTHLADYQPPVVDVSKAIAAGLEGKQIGEHVNNEIQTHYSKSLRSFSTKTLERKILGSCVS